MSVPTDAAAEIPEESSGDGPRSQANDGPRPDVTGGPQEARVDEDNVPHPGGETAGS